MGKRWELRFFVDSESTCRFDGNGTSIHIEPSEVGT